jgi:N-hydroxyarylamine O-acetyltransferase
MTTDVDLDLYFERIGYGGPTAPSLATLQSLHACHTEAIAFENLNPLLGLPVPLDTLSLVRKLVVEGRGGYCFEHNMLFGRALEALGFRVTGLAARVLWNSDDDAITKRSHMLLRVDLEDHTCIADVGFGGQTLTGPLELVPDVEQTTPHEDFRLVALGGDYKLQARIEKDWRTLYRFDLQRQHAVDYEAANYFLSTHPGSIFRTTLRAARAAPGARHALLNNTYAVHHTHGRTEKRTLTTVEEIRRTLEREFLLELPPAAGLDAALQKFL